MPRAPGRCWRPVALVGATALAVARAADASAGVAGISNLEISGSASFGAEVLTDGSADQGTARADAPPGLPNATIVGTDGEGSDIDQVSSGSFWHSGSFDYHKDPFPLDWHHDGMTMALASVGLVIAASGGIGGGGMLVPLFMLVLALKPKHAIALSNFTILGGAIANTMLNAGKKHPELNRGLIDWDLIIIMEPLTIFGAVFGSLMSKVLPNIVLTVSLVIILAFMGHRTLKKGIKMWFEESMASTRVEQEMLSTTHGENGTSPSARCLVLEDSEADRSYVELQSDCEGGDAPKTSQFAKIVLLTVCFVGTCLLTVLRGGGHFSSPFGFVCGSLGYWLLYFGAMPWVLVFAIYFRNLLVVEFEQKVRNGHTFGKGEVQWNPHNTVKYPILCAVSGLLAGLFGVGGGIVKGPLMLEMGIIPSVASASAAAMILYTSAAASTSYMVFGLLHWQYGVLFFFLGMVCTAFGQYTVGKWVKRHQRQSPIVLSIGLVITLSSLCVAVNTISSLIGPEARSLFRPHGVCTAEA